MHLYVHFSLLIMKEKTQLYRSTKNIKKIAERKVTNVVFIEMLPKEPFSGKAWPWQRKGRDLCRSREVIIEHFGKILRK
jgi:hypothetical protein